MDILWFLPGKWEESRSVNVIFAALCWSYSLLGPLYLVIFCPSAFLNPACIFPLHLTCPQHLSALWCSILHQFQSNYYYVPGTSHKCNSKYGCLSQACYASRRCKLFYSLAMQKETGAEPWFNSSPFQSLTLWSTFHVVYTKRVLNQCE